MTHLLDRGRAFCTQGVAGSKDNSSGDCGLEDGRHYVYE